MQKLFETLLKYAEYTHIGVGVAAREGAALAGPSAMKTLSLLDLLSVSSMLLRVYTGYTAIERETHLKSP